MPEPKPIAWGYVTRELGNGRQILIAERFKAGDPQRAGQLVIPGGGYKGLETSVETAVREVREETTIRAFFGEASERFHSHLLQYPTRRWNTQKISGRLEGGIFYLDYKDTGNQYAGRLHSLFPEDPKQEPPADHVSDDTRKPRYIFLPEAMERKDEFTPAIQIVLDVIADIERRIA